MGRGSLQNVDTFSQQKRSPPPPPSLSWAVSYALPPHKHYFSVSPITGERTSLFLNMASLTLWINCMQNYVRKKGQEDETPTSADEEKHYCPKKTPCSHSNCEEEATCVLRVNNGDLTLCFCQQHETKLYTLFGPKDVWFCQYCGNNTCHMILSLPSTNGLDYHFCKTYMRKYCGLWGKTRVLFHPVYIILKRKNTYETCASEISI